jgi:hypothetical protein
VDINPQMEEKWIFDYFQEKQLTPTVTIQKQEIAQAVIRIENPCVTRFLEASLF